MDKDRVFADKMERVEPFQFNEKVTRVFDDMLTRSVPLYQESIKRQAQLVEKYYQDNTRIYDLGCSNGNLGLEILKEMGRQEFNMIGVDSSWPMIDKYDKRLEKAGNEKRVSLVCGLLENVRIKNASTVLINLTLQFLKPGDRDQLVQNIFNGMVSGGILLLSEKTINSRSDLDALWFEFYNRFKKENGYSSLEISQKRDALEKVLIPDTIETHQHRLNHAGFINFDIYLKWFNFASMIAFKP